MMKFPTQETKEQWYTKDQKIGSVRPFGSLQKFYRNDRLVESFYFTITYQRSKL